MARAYIALGGNVGDARAAIAQAIRRFCDGEEVTLLARSSDYRTPPWGVTDQPPFVNACIAIDTRLDPRALLARAQQVESACGRDRTRERRWGPRPLDIDMGEVLKQMNIETEFDAVRRQPIFLGGPVQTERGFVIHKPHGAWDVTLKVSDELGVTSSRDILEAIARGEGPAHSLVALGYAGWGPGQIEREIGENAWINVDADDRVLFDTPSEQRWEAAAALNGVDIHRVSTHSGRA